MLSVFLLLGAVACTEQQQDPPAATTGVSGLSPLPTGTQKKASIVRLTEEGNKGGAAVTTKAPVSSKFTGGKDADANGSFEATCNLSVSDQAPALFVNQGIKLLALDHQSTDSGVAILIKNYSQSLFSHATVTGSGAMTWSFKVPADGTYAVCLEICLDDAKARGVVLQVGSGEKYAVTLSLGNDYSKYANDREGAYISGISLPLKAGDTTLTLTPAAGAESLKVRAVVLSKESVGKATELKFGTSTFSAKIPAAFAASGVIKVKGELCEENSQEIVINPQEKYIYVNPNGLPGSAAHAVVKVIVGNDSHYYINNAEAPVKALYDNKDAPLSECYIRWTVEVPADGYYDLGLYIRLKAGSRYGVLQIDNLAAYGMSFSVTESQAAGLIDKTEGSYVAPNGMRFYLSKGTHTITYSVPQNASVKISWHFRDLYLIPVAQ